jgi:hypothetical protein
VFKRQPFQLSLIFILTKIRLSIKTKIGNKFQNYLILNLANNMIGNIFNKFPLTTFINDYRQKLIERVDTLEINDNTETSELIEDLKIEYTIYPIVFGNRSHLSQVSTQLLQEMIGVTRQAEKL